MPLDTSASAIVLEQLARLSLLEDAPPQAREIAAKTKDFLEGLLSHLTSRGDPRAASPGVLLNGCFNQPKAYATASELIWGTAYLLFALYYLKTGRVIE